MSVIQPIETRYNGYRFRSRLEARWAVFFDYVRTRGHDKVIPPYVYEHEGYALPSGWYLPDFYFPDLHTFAEVKPLSALPTTHFEFAYSDDEYIDNFGTYAISDSGWGNELVLAVELSRVLAASVIVLYGDPANVFGIDHDDGIRGGAVCFDQGKVVGQHSFIAIGYKTRFPAARAAREKRFEHGE
jgi:hypothetical protein